MNKKHPLIIIFTLFLAIVFFFISLGGCERKNSDADDPAYSETGERILYERDLKKLVKEGYYVVVDKDEKDIFIHEDLYSKDYNILIDLAMIKSVALGETLYTEDEATFGTERYIEEVHPTDHRAYQDFLMTEIQLLDPSYFDSQDRYRDNYNRAEAMDKNRTIDEMIAFIDRYPESKWISRAFSYIEYQLCVAQKNPEEALTLYESIKEEHPEFEKVQTIADVYIERAHRYQKEYQKNS